MNIVRPNLFEDLKKSEPKYGCVMLYANIPDWKKLIKRIINEKDVYYDNTSQYGYELSPHITVILGVHHDDIVDKNIIYNIIKDIPEMSFKLNEIGIFDNTKDDSKLYDVVKFDIKPSQSLLNARDKFMELPNTQTFPDYEPHMTICYVKKGEGKKYKRILKEPITIKFNQGVYSEPDDRKTYFDLKKKKYSK